MEDTIGLQNFFNENLEDYWWDKRVEAEYLYLCKFKSSIKIK